MKILPVVTFNTSDPDPDSSGSTNFMQPGACSNINLNEYICG